MSDFMPFYICDGCGKQVDAKDVTSTQGRQSNAPQRFFCPGCVWDFVETDGAQP